MSAYLCNPVNVEYRYQYVKDRMTQKLSIGREAADPSMVQFQGKYYIFASMTLGVWVSEDMAHWENHRLPDELPLYDYAPDVEIVGDYVYLSASRRGTVCDFYRTKDILNGPYERIEGTFDFWDPALFNDDDGRLYFYWGCANTTPIWGVELDPITMKPIGEKKELIWGRPGELGFERNGEEHSLPPLTEDEIEARIPAVLEQMHIPSDAIDGQTLHMLKGFLSQNPYIEGAWMNKHNGKYYLQYAFPGTEYNIYGNGVYESDAPLGPFHLADNNPYSYKPGGFLPGAGHGSTAADRYGNLWHTATMRISKNFNFERRVGLWPAGFDSDGVLFCNERYGDWPMKVEQSTMDPWKNPEWYLLSYKKAMTASSSVPDKGPALAADENVQTWWQAASNAPGEWLMMDLGKVSDVRAVQINFADDTIDRPMPGQVQGAAAERYIDDAVMYTRWRLEGSPDGENFFMIEDKSEADTNLPHDLVVCEDGLQARYLKLTVLEIPYGEKPCLSGLRVFGIGDGPKPLAPSYTARRISDLDMKVEIQPQENTVGYNILWGYAPDKLYHSYMIFDTEQTVGAMITGREAYVRVDAFNESGITEGTQIVKIHKTNTPED